MTASTHAHLQLHLRTSSTNASWRTSGVIFLFSAVYKDLKIEVKEVKMSLYECLFCRGVSWVTCDHFSWDYLKFSACSFAAQRRKFAIFYIHQQKPKVPTSCQTQENMTSKPVSIVLGVAGFLALYERMDFGTSLIEQSSMYFHHEPKKGVFGFIRKNSDGNSSMHLSDGLYIDTATAKTSVKYIAALLLSIVCLFAQFAHLTFSTIWPVSLKDIYLIYHGQPGSILNLAYKCSLAQVRILFSIPHQHLQWFTTSFLFLVTRRETFGRFVTKSFGGKKLASLLVRKVWAKCYHMVQCLKEWKRLGTASLPHIQS